MQKVVSRYQDGQHLVWPASVAMRAVQRGSVILTRWVREAVTWGGGIGGKLAIGQLRISKLLKFVFNRSPYYLTDPV